MLAALGANEIEAIVTYTITDADVAGPFTTSIPADMMAKAKLERLGYTLAARSAGRAVPRRRRRLLRQLNPGVDVRRRRIDSRCPT